MIIQGIAVVLVMLIAALLMAGGVYAFYQFVLPKWVYVYKLDEHGFRICLFHLITVISIPYSNMDSVSLFGRGSGYWRYIFALNWQNKLLVNNSVVIAKKKWFMYKYLIISPDDAQGFIEHVTQKIRADVS